MIINSVPLGRFGTPEEIAKPVSGGSIVNISSVMSTIAAPMLSIYAATKGPSMKEVGERHEYR